MKWLNYNIKDMRSPIRILRGLRGQGPTSKTSNNMKDVEQCEEQMKIKNNTYK